MTTVKTKIPVPVLL